VNDRIAPSTSDDAANSPQAPASSIAADDRPTS
jgi:hypothetical protein